MFEKKEKKNECCETGCRGCPWGYEPGKKKGTGDKMEEVNTLEESHDKKETQESASV